MVFGCLWGAPADVEVWGVGPGPSQPAGSFGAGDESWEVFHVDADDGVGHDWWSRVLFPVAAAAEPWVQLCPGGNGDRAVAGVVRGLRTGRCARRATSSYTRNGLNGTRWLIVYTTGGEKFVAHKCVTVSAH